MEHIAIFGEKGWNTIDAGKQYFAAGVVAQVREGAPENIANITLDEKTWDEYLVAGPLKSGVGAKKKFAFMGNGFMIELSQILKEKEQINTQQVQIAGLTFFKYSAPNGNILYLYNHNAFENAYDRSCLIVDASQTKLRSYKEQGMLQLHQDIQNPNYAGHQSEWRSIMSTQVLNPHSAGFITLT
jgi:hypothetical protein